MRQGGIRVISRAARLRSLIACFLWTIDPLMAFPSFRPAVCHYGCSQPLGKKLYFHGISRKIGNGLENRAT